MAKRVNFNAMTKYGKLSENSLVKKAQKGDTKAFEELIKRSDDYLKGWMLKKTQSAQKTEELLQITYIKCWRKIKKFLGNSLFKTWACRVGYNLFLDDLKKQSNIREISLEGSESVLEYVSHSSNEGYFSLKSKDEERELTKILDKLPKIHRDVLSSFAIEELSYKEIAKKLQCSVGTVMSRLYYARKKAQFLISKNKELKYHGNVKQSSL